MDLEIKNKVAVVIGGSKGIGFAIAQALSLEGVKVCIMSRSSANLEDARAKIKNESDCDVDIYKGDIANNKDLRSLSDFLYNGIGFPDIIINNCGGPPPGSIMDHSDEVWMKVFEQNLLSFARLIRQFSNTMIDRKWGRYINISSTIAIEPSSSMSLSATMRAGLAALSKSASLTLAKEGVTINTICPGCVSTERANELINLQSKSRGISIKEVIADIEMAIPLNRFANPKEIADLAVFLSSNRANYITGRVHAIDGGLTKSY